MRPIRSWAARRVAVLAAVAVLLLTTALGAAIADDPDTITTRLEPGLNFVGWVGPETPVAELFAAVPEIEVVYAWDASQQEWLVASPRAPATLRTLRTLRPGMGLALRISSQRSVKWSRPFSPASGFVWLSPGLNLVAWTGPDNDAIANAERRFGLSLLSLHRWQRETERYNAYDPRRPETADAFSAPAPGDALWIEVQESIAGYWQQPTDSLATIRGTLTSDGGAGLAGIEVTAASPVPGDRFYAITDQQGSFATYARTDLPYTLSFDHPDKLSCTLFYSNGAATRERIQATALRAAPDDPIHLQVRIPDGACGWEIRGKLVDSDGSPLAGRLWLSGPGAVADAVASSDGSFAIPTKTHGAYTLGIRLADDCDVYYRENSVAGDRNDASPIQIADAHVEGLMVVVLAGACAHIRGTAVDREGMPLAGKIIRAYAVDDSSTYARIAEDGSFSVRVPGNGAYRLVITLRVGDTLCDAHYRNGGATAAQNAATALTVTGADVTGVRFVLLAGTCGRLIAGRVVDQKGEPVVGKRIFAHEQVGSSWGYTNLNDTTDAAGLFSITVPTAGPWQLRLRLDTCSFWYVHGKAPANTREGSRSASLMWIPGSTRNDITFILPAQGCGWWIQGTAVDSDGKPLTGMTVEVNYSDRVTYGALIAEDGSFSVAVPRNGSYQLRIYLDNECWVYHHPDGAVSSYDEAGPVQVADADVANVRFVAPSQRCGWEIRGKLVDAEGSPLAGRTITALSLASSGRRNAETASDGSFVVLTDANGPQQLHIGLTDDCRFYYQDGGITFDAAAASPIQITDAHVDGVAISVPSDTCRWWIRGTAVDSQGRPLGGMAMEISANRVRYRAAPITEDGSFSIAAPRNGSYQLRVWLDDECWVYHHPDGAVSSYDEAWAVQVADGDVADVRFVAPKQRCGWVIRGKVLNADGTPFPAEMIYADEDEASLQSALVAADGSFSIRVPTDGLYRLQTGLAGACAVYYRSDGATAKYDLAELVKVDGGDVTDLQIIVPGRVCGWHIAGRVLDSEGRPAGQSIYAIGEDSSEFAGPVEGDGSFSILGPTTGSWRLKVLLGGCEMYYHVNGAVASEESASLVNVADYHLDDIHVEIPAHACVLQIRGRVIDADEQGVADAWVWAGTDQREGGGTLTEADGSFAITVPVSGMYWLGLWWSDDCYVYYNESAEASAQHAARVAVVDADVTDIVIRLPENPCG